MKRHIRLFLVMIAVVVLSVSLVACLPKIASDKTITGIVEDGLEHAEFNNYKGYRYGNEQEKYNMTFRLGLPTNYDSAKKYPLVIFLHFLGAQGVDNESQMKNYFIDSIEKSGEECIVFLPQLPSENMAFSDNFYKTKDMSSLYNSCLDAIIDKYSVDTNRLYITGVSMGSHNTWELLSKSPDKYAAAMPVSFGTSADKAEAIKNIPIRMAHSLDDEVVPIATSQEIYNALKAIGGNVVYKEYATGGHGTCYEFYKDIETWTWLFAQSK